MDFAAAARTIHGRLVMAMLMLAAQTLWLPPAQAGQAQKPHPPFVQRIEKQTERSSGWYVSVDRPTLSHPVADTRVAKWLTTLIDRFAGKAQTPAGRDRAELTGSLAFQSAVAGFLSLKFNVGEYLGGAHPNVYIQTFVFDMKTGRNLALTDLFTSAERALAVISRESIRQLEQARGFALTPMERGRLQPAAQNYLNFVLDTGGLRLFFPVYQTGDRSLGEQRAIIPYPRLQHLFKAKFARLFTQPPSRNLP